MMSEVIVRVLPTPNPNANKYVVSDVVKSQGKATFSRPSEALGVRLAEDLFKLDGVRQLHFFENVITVTHSDEADPQQLEPQVMAVIKSRMPAHDPNFLTDEERRKVDRSHLPPDVQKIEEILDQTVRMYLQGDGGDIDIVSYRDHKLEVRYQGACGTCPSSTAATLDAISGILREQFDPEIEIIPV